MAGVGLTSLNHVYGLCGGGTVPNSLAPGLGVTGAEKCGREWSVRASWRRGGFLLVGLHMKGTLWALTCLQEFAGIK